MCSDRSNEDGVGAAPTRVHVAVQGWPLHNVAHFVTPDASPVTNIETWKDFLLVFKSTHIFVCRFSGIEDLEIVGEAGGIGSTHESDVCSVFHGGLSMVFFASHDGFYAWDGKARYISGPIETAVRSGGALDSTTIAHYPDAHQVWFYPRSGGLVFVFDYTVNQWSVFQFGVPFYDIALLRSSEKSRAKVYGLCSSQDEVKSNDKKLGPHAYSRRGGIVRVEFDAGQADEISGISYPARWHSANFPFGRHQVRRYSHLRLDLVERPGNANVFWSLDEQTHQYATQSASPAQTVKVDTETDRGEGFGAFVFNSGKFQDNQLITQRVALYGGPARRFSWGIETNGSTSDSAFHVLGCEIDTRRKEGRR